MKRWYIWDDNGECRAEGEEILQENTATSMVEILPRLIRRKVDAALKTRNYVAAMNILTIHWGGQKWLSFHSISKAKPGIHNRIDLRLLKLLVRKLE